MKNLIIIIGGITVLGLGCILGFRSLVSHIYHQVDCQQFNIDNIEVRTGIDIPAVTSVECQCNESRTVKTSTFHLDSDQLDLEKYVLRNNFKPSGGQYHNDGKRRDTRWRATLNQDTYQLTVIVEYL